MEDFIKKLDDLKEKYQTGKIDLDTLIHRCFTLGSINTTDQLLKELEKTGEELDLIYSPIIREWNASFSGINFPDYDGNSLKEALQKLYDYAKENCLL